MRKWMASGIRHVALAGAYALGYALFREISFSHWIPLSGFRVLCLLFIPTRYWAALAFGEMIPLGFKSYDLIGEFGVVWAGLNLVPIIALAMPVIFFFKKKISRFGSAQAINATKLMSCLLAVSLVWTMHLLVTFSAMTLPSGYEKTSNIVTFSQYFLGEYLGILTIVPLGLYAATLAGVARTKASTNRSSPKKLFFDIACVLLPLIVALAYFGKGLSSISQLVQMAMFVPVVWIALRHGWQGVAVSGSIVSVCIILMMPQVYDPVTLQAEAFVAFAMSTMILFGSKISRFVLEQKDAEPQSLSIELVPSGFEGQFGLIKPIYGFAAAGPADADVDAPYFDRRFEATQNLTSQPILAGRALYRRGIDQETMENLEREADLDPVLKVLAGQGIVCRYEQAGVELTSLSLWARIALHNIARDIVAYSLDQGSMREINFYSRAGSSNGVNWTVMRLTCLYRSEVRVMDASEKDAVLAGLDVAIKPLWVIRNAVCKQGGELHLKIFPDSIRVTFLMKSPLLHKGGGLSFHGSKRAHP